MPLAARRTVTTDAASSSVDKSAVPKVSGQAQSRNPRDIIEAFDGLNGESDAFMRSICGIED